MLRTHTCGELNETCIGKKVKLTGWIHTIRDHKKVAFIDLRDRYGLTQIVYDPSKIKEELKDECVILVEGKVVKREDKFLNKKIPTGAIEVKADSIKLLNKVENLPFEVNKDKELNDEIRLKYRYLDLRKPANREKLVFRHKVAIAVREFLNNEGFIEVETPLLVKNTPGGARNYIVPSRTNKGKFYALPESPQLYKQILMIAGLDKYYQIAKCLRDEDLRQDRQPEFTQIDIEMSFLEEEDIFNLIEGLLKGLFKKVLNENIETPFLRMSYADAVSKYKCDKPDLRKGKDKFAFCWVVDFPLLEYSQEEKKLVSMHHPFTSPKEEDLKFLEKNPEKVRARAYDIVLNGVEVGGGSIRINKPDMQQKIFDVLKIDKKTAKEKFGFLIEALSYGAPVHGGIAIGFDRLVALMQGLSDIREVIAFPKNKAAENPMDGCPAEITERQLKELGIKIEKVGKK